MPDASAAPAEPGPLTHELLADAAARHLSPAARATLGSLVRPSSRLVRASAGEQAVGRLGGPAMLPVAAPWPTWQGRGLEVVAVLDLARLPEVPGLPLPRAGWLTFFYDAVEQSAWGFDPTQRDAWRVVHALEAAARPAPVGTETFPEVALAAVDDLTTPDLFEDALGGLLETERDGLVALADELPTSDAPVHRVGGWPDLVQNSMWLGVQLASNGIYVGGPDGYRHPRAAELTSGAQDWRLLLQVDTDDDAGMMWGDVGRLYFLVREQDLLAGDLGRCWFELQCS